MSFTIQKANLWKRVSALLFDIILTATLIIGLSAAVSAVLGYEKYSAQLSARYEAIEQQYGVDFDISEEDYQKLTEEEKATLQTASQALAKDEEFIKVSNMMFYLSLGIVSVSCFLGVFIWDFALPLIFGNGQTLGKKIFGTAVMRTNGVKISSPVLFIRAMIGTYAIETMFPLLILIMIYFGVLGGVGLITLVLFAILQIGVITATNTNSAIHDLLCDTVVVDLASQQIFESDEARNAYLAEEQAQNVLNSSN